MAAKPVDRIRSMITDLERGARTLGDDLRKRAGGTKVSSDIESALRQLLTGLTNIAAQLEKAAGELRRYLEAGAGSGKRGKAKSRKSTAGRTAGKGARNVKKAASAKSAGTSSAKNSARSSAKAAAPKASRSSSKKASAKK